MLYQPHASLAAHERFSSDGEASIGLLTQDFCTAFNTGNYDQCAALFSPDAMFAPPGFEQVNGTRVIEHALERLADEGYDNLRLETTRIETAGDLAMEWGRYTISARGHEGTVTAHHGTFMRAWRRFGAWRIVAECWSSTLTPS